MLYMLDTNIISYYSEGNKNVIRKLEEHLSRIAGLKIENWTK